MIFHYIALAGVIWMATGMVYFAGKRMKADAPLDASRAEKKILVHFGLLLLSILTFIGTVYE